MVKKKISKKTGKKNGSRVMALIRNRYFRFMVKAGIVVFAAMSVYFLYGLPSADDVRPLETTPSIAILANDGSLIARYGGLKGNAVTLADIPPLVVKAVIAIEDRRFYKHYGVDPVGLARAMWVNIRAGSWVQGGSTITQQLAKNLFLTPDKTLRRKVQEALLALRIEHKYTKDEILAAYLNRVYYGAGAYGIDSAARTYFNKSASGLTLWEGAVLAGLLKAPSRFSPTADPERSAKRARVVIRVMKDLGYIDDKISERELKKEDVKIVGADASDARRYFADWVVNQIDSFIANNESDLVVKTTFDPNLQRLAEAQQEALFKQLKEEERISQVSIVTLGMDGAVLAMIGGRDYGASQFNRATQAARQPGSAFKPFVFLAALELGFSPDNLIEDAPFKTGSYRPTNYDGKYYGTVTLTDALALSLNTATIRLLQDVGLSRLLDVTQRLGFTKKFKPELATGLGAGETNLLELTNAYAVIANGGHAVWPYGVLSISDTKGRVLYQYENIDHAQLFSDRDIDALDRMLVQVIARGTAQSAQLRRGHVAGKTGTSQNYRDAWFVGYTDRLVTGVWMGNDDNTPMNRISGGKYPARLWRDYMQDAIFVDVPAFRANFHGSYTPPGSEDQTGGFTGGFSDMLQRWSTGQGDSRIKPDVAPPQYNQ